MMTAARVNESRIVNLPAGMWKAMVPILQLQLSAHQREGAKRHGFFASFRLQNGVVKESLLVNWDGQLVAEDIGDRTIRPEGFVQLAFETAEIAAWGWYELVRKPTLLHPFRKMKVWRDRVMADGREI